MFSTSKWRTTQVSSDIRRKLGRSWNNCIKCKHTKLKIQRYENETCKITTIIKHPSYNKQYSNDISKMKVAFVMYTFCQEAHLYLWCLVRMSKWGCACRKLYMGNHTFTCNIYIHVRRCQFYGHYQQVTCLVKIFALDFPSLYFIGCAHPLLQGKIIYKTKYEHCDIGD